MNRTAIAIHGGAGADTRFIRENLELYKSGLEAAVLHGHRLLQSGASAVDAVQETVKILEDNPVFNAGRGAALNRDGHIEMDAAIMDGKTLRAGAVSMIRGVRNPISLARGVMDLTPHVYVAGEGAMRLADVLGLEQQPESYFITEYQRELLIEDQMIEVQQGMKRKHTGTVGCVAIDANGNLASATSTGGICNSHPGRIGDSCIIGSGCYAHNGQVAVSCTGEGELIMTGVIGHKVAMLMELRGMSVQQACEYVVKNVEKPFLGDLGIISVDSEGNVGLCYNSERMHRASVNTNGEVFVSVYDGEK
jgi:L-asparaginase / beta-aspartyl-peptidase